MIQFILNYVDKCNIQSLEITIVNQYQFNNYIYSIDESEAKNIYLLLTSEDAEDVEDIQEYLTELIQFDDIENLSKLSQKGLI